MVFGFKKLVSSFSDAFLKNKIDYTALLELEESLILADLGPKISSEIVEAVKKSKLNSSCAPHELRAIIVQYLSGITSSLAAPEDGLLTRRLFSDNISHAEDKEPLVIMFCGVNGSGKTTTIGKFLLNLTSRGNKVIVAAADTFRAAAVDQLEVLTRTFNVQIVKPQRELEEPSSLAYKAFNAAVEQKADVLIVDTSGRLHNNINLMQELGKIDATLQKLVQKKDNLYKLLTLDATTGQNMKSQVLGFLKYIQLSGVVLTKLDGAAKGGAIVDALVGSKLPIYAIGNGEKHENLTKFSLSNFIEDLVG